MSCSTERICILLLRIEGHFKYGILKRPNFKKRKLPKSNTAMFFRRFCLYRVNNKAERGTRSWANAKCVIFTCNLCSIRQTIRDMQSIKETHLVDFIHFIVLLLFILTYCFPQFMSAWRNEWTFSLAAQTLCDADAYFGALYTEVTHIFVSDRTNSVLMRVECVYGGCYRWLWSRGDQMSWNDADCKLHVDGTLVHTIIKIHVNVVVQYPLLR